MNPLSGKFIRRAIEFLGVLTISLIGLVGTTSCDCDSPNITYHINPTRVSECFGSCPTVLTNVLNVNRNNTQHYSGGWPLPPGSSINFLANRKGGDVVHAQFVRVCSNGRVEICDGNTITPNFTNDCSRAAVVVNIPCRCKCYP